MEHITYNFNEMIDRSNTQSIKNDKLPPNSPEGTISMWIADMDFRCAQPIIDALHRRVDNGIFGYSAYDSASCKEATQGWFRRRFQWEVDTKDIFFCPGIVPAVAALVKLLAQPGEGVIIQRPVYYPFTNMIIGNGRQVVNNPLIYKDGDYTMDFADLEEKLADPANKALILCSPHNPVGRVWTPEELGQVVALAKKYDKWIISDEIHFDLVRRGVVHHPLTKLHPEYAHRIVVCTAPSKTFNVAGMQMSNIVITDKGLQEKWSQLLGKEMGLMSSNALAITALMAAYNEGEDWLEQVLDYLDGNFAYAKEYLAKHLPEAKVIDAQGTYLLWIDLNAYCGDTQKLEELMLQKAGLALDEGYIFGEEGAGFERINIACPRVTLEECLRRLCAALLD